MMMDFFLFTHFQIGFQVDYHYGDTSHTHTHIHTGAMIMCLKSFGAGHWKMCNTDFLTQSKHVNKHFLRVLWVPWVQGQKSLETVTTLAM